MAKAQTVELDIPTIDLKIVSRNALLMHSERGVNVLDPLVKQKKAITGKRKKTDEDLAAIARLEWEISLYFDDDLGPYIPGQNIEACIVEGAKLEKRGKDIARGLNIVEDRIKLDYKGPRELEKLWADPRFNDIRSVGQQQVRIMRCRPIFHEWSCKFTIAYDKEIFDPADLIRIIQKAGKYCGLGDFRRRFGRFDVEVLT